MPATIVETNTKKFKRKDIDPITLDIIENAMMNARYEMDAVGVSDGDVAGDS
jgi:N-methylhydantoinase B